MLDCLGEMCKTELLFGSLESNLKPLSGNAGVHIDESAQFGEIGSVFSELEEEVMRLQLLLQEPKCNDIVDTVLDINAQKNFYVNEYVESAYRRADDEVLNSSFTEGSKEFEQFLDGLSEDNCDMVPCEENSHFDACEDYLSDVMFDERAPCHSKMKFDYHSIDLDGRQTKNSSPCHSKKMRTWVLQNFNLPFYDPHTVQNVKIHLQVTGAPQRFAESSATKIFKSSRVSSYVQNNRSVNEMSSEKLRQVFEKLFGRRTIITDEEWLRQRILLGLQNSDKWKENLTLKREFSKPNGNKRVEISSATEDLLKAPSPFSSVFSFKRKRRVQHVKKRKGSEFLKNFCFSLESNSECDRRKSKISKKHPEDNIRHDVSKQQHCRGGAIVPLTTKDEGQKQVDHSNAALGSPVESLEDNDMHSVESLEDNDTYSVESEDDTSENEWKPKRNMQARKNYQSWSLPEVINLVEGVSKYGVGRWTYIKRLFFRSSPRRTPTNLKDKWRNLLSTCRGRSQKKKARSTQKGILHSIPQHILQRVRDLAAIHPYPRRRKVGQVAASI